jgi:hypothetical protein
MTKKGLSKLAEAIATLNTNDKTETAKEKKVPIHGIL